MDTNIKQSKTLSVITIIAIALLIISVSIALPIVFRPFYYWQIKTLDIVKQSGYDYTTIKVAYDEMMDFCLGLNPVFSTGALKFSNDEYLHFVDVRNLFFLDFGIIITSSLTLITVGLLKKFKVVKTYMFNNHANSYYASMGLLVFFTVLGLVAMTDFSEFFVFFHAVFFPGKTNWLFSPMEDQIINILPEEFFANCGLAIVLILISCCGILIIKDIKRRKYI